MAAAAQLPPPYTEQDSGYVPAGIDDAAEDDYIPADIPALHGAHPLQQHDDAPSRRNVNAGDDEVSRYAKRGCRVLSKMSSAAWHRRTCPE